jgi:hypothetical protein
VQRTTFERVFGCRYVKSTVCRHKNVWRRAPPELIDKFMAMGSAEAAIWGEFVKQVERPGKTNEGQRTEEPRRQDGRELLSNSNTQLHVGDASVEAGELLDSQEPHRETPLPADLGRTPDQPSSASMMDISTHLDFFVQSRP